MRILEIFYYRYFTNDGQALSIGGIETYIRQLAELACSMQITTRIFQVGTFMGKAVPYAEVYAVDNRDANPFPALYARAEELRRANDVVVSVIANDTLIPTWDVPNSLVIQHGIGFDYETERKGKEWMFMLLNAYQNFKRVRALRHVDELVCVDNNYICWYRTMTRFRKVKMTPILNFTPLGPERVLRKGNGKVRLVFARRFVKIRGTRLFAPVVQRLLETFPQLEVVWAGTGPDEGYLRSLFGENNRVRFTTYDATGSVAFHGRFDIAVVPTIFSEGTSLSLLEAMSAHCAVVCTNVGGMTNIVLDGFNGLMVSPDEEELYAAVARLIVDKELRLRLSTNAYETVKASFSLAKWQGAWRKVLTRKFACIENRKTIPR